MNESTPFLIFFFLSFPFAYLVLLPIRISKRSPVVGGIASDFHHNEFYIVCLHPRFLQACAISLHQGEELVYLLVVRYPNN